MTADYYAMIWLTLLSAVAAVYLAMLLLRSDYDRWESCLYLPTYLMGRLLWRVAFTNSAPADLQGGAVLVANHRSSVDPFFVQLAARRRVHWMVAKEYCRHFAFGPLLRALQVIPTNRSGMDTASTKAAIRLTKQGRLVGMFPEGRLNRGREPLLPIRSGAALVATKAGVPMVPLWIEGSPQGKNVWSPVFMPARVAITFGQPIWPPDTTATQQRDSLQREVEKMVAQRDDALADSDALIVQWARQIVELAGCAGLPIELASKRKRRKRS
ncbi:MAG: 1-acyl-sn-glycerol-3-phosphate acyltransferase [Planctomycetales bacterium]|nr:1-acyl-sn-glycerol-3-phosphate acyltransferase [Planctomycetales bacterium]